MSGVFPNVRGALTFAAESQDVVTAATVAIGVLELGVETSAEIDRAGASCTEGGIRTQGDEREVS